MICDILIPPLLKVISFIRNNFNRKLESSRSLKPLTPSLSLMRERGSVRGVDKTSLTS
jgi:hypothetical protein